MADRRSTIKQSVELNIGRANDPLENILCDEALKVALLAHPFDDSVIQPSDFTITTNATDVDISGVSNILTIVTARILQVTGDLYLPLKLKNRTWWDIHVVNPEDNQIGWPEYGLHFGTNITLDRPAESNLKLVLRLTTDKVFDNDNTECPIAVLDKFVIKYVTAQMFKQLKQFNAAKEWRQEALGPYFDTRGDPGGFLLAAINCDKANIGEEMSMLETPGNKATSILNEIGGHDDEGNTRGWY